MRAQKNTGPAVVLATDLMLPCEDLTFEAPEPDGLEAVVGTAAKVEVDIVRIIEAGVDRVESESTTAARVEYLSESMRELW